MEGNSLIQAIDRIQPWSRGDDPAPHKPLLLLYMLGRHINGEHGGITFTELEPILKELLIEFGPTRQSYQPSLQLNTTDFGTPRRSKSKRTNEP